MGACGVPARLNCPGELTMLSLPLLHLPHLLEDLVDAPILLVAICPVLLRYMVAPMEQTLKTIRNSQEELARRIATDRGADMEDAPQNREQRHASSPSNAQCGFRRRTVCHGDPPHAEPTRVAMHAPFLHTSLGHRPHQAELRAAGIEACLMKPIRQSLLCKALRRPCASHQRNQSHQRTQTRQKVNRPGKPYPSKLSEFRNTAKSLIYRLVEEFNRRLQSAQY
jgi:hypothetical protein